MTPFCFTCSTPLPLNSVEGVYCKVCCDVAKWELADTSYDPATLLDPREMSQMRWEEEHKGLNYEQ